MRQKGFTLIELLAVIVILAIIALIATPMILGVVSNAKKGGAESSALGWIDAVEKHTMLNMLDSDNTISDGTYEVSELDVKVKGQSPKSGWVKIEKGQVKDYSLVIGDFTVTPKDNNPSKAVAVKGNNSNYKIGYAVSSNNDYNLVYVGNYADKTNIKNKYLIKGDNGSDIDPMVFDTESECRKALGGDTSSEYCQLGNYETKGLIYQSKPDDSWVTYLKYYINDKNILEDIKVCFKLDGNEYCLDKIKSSSDFNTTSEKLKQIFKDYSCSLDDDGKSFGCSDEKTVDAGLSNEKDSFTIGAEAEGPSCYVYYSDNITFANCMDLSQ